MLDCRYGLIFFFCCCAPLSPTRYSADRWTKGDKEQKKSNLDSVIDICHLTAFQGPGPPGLGERPVEILDGCHELPCCVMDIEWEADMADGQDF